MAKKLSVAVKVTADDETTGYKAQFPATGYAGSGVTRDGNNGSQSAGVLIVAGSSSEAVPLGDVAVPLAFGFRRLSGNGAVLVGILDGATFTAFAGLNGNGEAGGVPLPPLGSGVLTIKNEGAAAASVEYFLG